MILAGDVGGTKVDLGLFDVKGGSPSWVAGRSYESSGFSGLESILDDFLEAMGVSAVERACFGVAGPVVGGKSKITNLPWVVAEESLAKRLGGAHVTLINDLAALAAAVPFLDGAQVETLQDGNSQSAGRIGVIAAGTGLGQAFLQPGGDGGFTIMESEGGQADFPPRSSVEADLLRFLLQKMNRVCVEDVLSGSGLVLIYRYILEREALTEPDWLTVELGQADPASVISANGLNKKSKACEQALALFVGVYGAIAGNLALQLLTRGGVFVGGGIAPKILPALKTGIFMEAFVAKGEFRRLLTEIPVRVILDSRSALWGAAHFALGSRLRR
jgi:glucokinase